MDELGENKSIINMFFKIPEDLRDEIIDENLDFIYPLPNREIIRHYATEDLKEEYIYAIIRQESAFDPYAKSWAEAYGLMQVIPEEAKKLYKNLNLEYKSADDLYLPSINIPIGTAILKRNLKKFNGEFIPSTCSYNAKADVVEKWLKTRYHQDPLVFIENIPYEETKLYVKLVLRNFVLNLRQTSSDAFFFPEELLTLSK
jgi:soluble lytic murein transglycosylase